MANIATIFNKFLYLPILLIHLGCFIFTTTTASAAGKQDNRQTQPSKKRRVSPLSQPSSPSHPKFKTQKALSSSWHFIKHLFSTKSSCKTATAHSSPQSTSTTARSSQQSLISLAQPDPLLQDPPRRRQSGSCPESDISADNNSLFFPLRNDIFPCTACGEIFQKPNLLEQHQATTHAVSELVGSDPGHNIVQIIFKSGWPENRVSPRVLRVLKIHNSPKILSRFEEYRETVKPRRRRVTVARHGGVTNAASPTATNSCGSTAPRTYASWD